MKKHMFRFTIFTVIFMASIQSFAFKWEKCKKVFKATPFKTTKGKLGDQLLNYSMNFTTEGTTNTSVSTTSYVSSTGDCRAFAKAEEERMRYVAETYVELQMEVAEGQGEHVASLANLYGCNNNARPHFSQVMKANHSKIFTDGPVENSLDVVDRISNTVLTNDVLRQNCNLEFI